ncbi:N-6 DNA methylase [Aneurinibacillus migulanus]|uniref:N-6 DNA methylase n=1 Tax=Aneurinibacillus migulanus TaxID=47500 RepID=UPI002E229250|nr:N-6 DNA methylase [Aneurinibacillus migulanus]MED4728320.1 N-6 DNA methylase [Aneurinibacillus migulanus]
MSLAVEEKRAQKVKKAKLTPEQQIRQNYLSSLSTEELFIHNLKITEIENTPLYIEPPTCADESHYFGWMRGTALQVETLVNGRWFYWLNLNAKADYSGEPVPEINLGNDILGSVGYKMLEKCVNICKQEGYGIEHFLEFIGYALGIAWYSKKPDISNRLWNRLYETFYLDVLLIEPKDYFSYLLSMNGYSGWLEFYPTPSHVSSMMVKLLGQDDPTLSTYEPTCGVGSILLQSNSLIPVGTDLNTHLIGVACIQAFMYMPWLIYTPRPILGLHFSKKEKRMNRYFEFDTNTRLYCGDALLGEFRAPIDIFKQNSEMIDVYISPLDLSKRAIFKYEEDMQKDWGTLSNEIKFAITAAYCRDMGFCSSIGNPPFGKLPKFTRESIRAIEEKNEQFLKARAERLRQTKIDPHPAVASSIQQNQDKIEQLEIQIELEEKTGMYRLAI